MVLVMSISDLNLLNMKLSIEADFITPDSKHGPTLVAHLLDLFLGGSSIPARHIPAVVPMDAFSIVHPDEKHWIVSEDSDINDEWGSGIRLQTGPMHWMVDAPNVVTNITRFIRDHGITDETCRFRLTYYDDVFTHFPKVKFLFLLNEHDQILNWQKYGPFMRKSHMEYMAADIHTNLYWQDVGQWYRGVHHVVESDPTYAVDFSRLNAGALSIDIIQGPHYEHRDNAIGNLMSDIGEAIRVSFDADPVLSDERAVAFWDKHASMRNPMATVRPPKP